MYNADSSLAGGLSREFQAAARVQLTGLPCICPHRFSACWATVVPRFELGTSLVDQFRGVSADSHNKDPKTCDLQVFLDGHGWFRTTDLSRVKRSHGLTGSPVSTGVTWGYAGSGRDRMYANVRGCMRIAAQETDLCHFDFATLSG